MPFTKDRSIRVSYQRSANQNWSGSSSSGGGSILLTRTRTGVSVKDYKELISRQLNASSDMTGVFDTLDFPSGRKIWVLRFLDWNYGSPPPTPIFRAECIGDFVPIYSYETPTLAPLVARNRATIAFLKKARQVQSEFSSPTFLGELRESLRMIRSPARGLRNILNAYVDKAAKLKRREPLRWKKNLSSLWLESVFGWIPLASSVQQGYIAYSRLVNTNDGKQRFISAYGIEEQVVPDRTYEVIDHYFCGIGLFPGTLRRRTIDKVFAKSYGMIVRRVDATLRDSLSRVGFNMAEFIPTAWELLPWSFLIDYFTNIGDVLGATAFQRADLSWHASTTVSTRTTDTTGSTTRERMIQATGAPWFVSFSGDLSSVRQKRRVVERIASSALGIPSLSLELPGRPAQFANMLALFTQANSVHPQRFYFRRT